MNSKRLFSTILIIALAISFIFISKSTFADGSISVNVSSTSGNPGDEVSVSISLSNIPSTGVNSATLVLEYDKSKLEFVKFNSGEIIGDKVRDISYENIDINAVYTQEQLAMIRNDSTKPPPQDGVKILYNDDAQTGDSHIKRNGIFGEAVFKIKSSFTSGTATIKPNCEDKRVSGGNVEGAFYKADAEIIPASFSSGTIAVPKATGATPTPTYTPTTTSNTTGTPSPSITVTPSISTTPLPGSVSNQNILLSSQNKKLMLEVEMKLGEPQININGKQQMINSKDSKIVPTFGENGALVPVNEISNIVGAICEWNAVEKKIKITYKGRNTEMWINKKKITVNGKTKLIDEFPELIQNKPYIPLCLASIAFECIVEWDKPNDTVKVKKFQ
ncbi:stalk domain-containing protein [Pseudobacteroides cellulosolvens]|uniref:Cellulosome anchoring protein cohesin region n=1 Tax=Pseudobacteroides cellulosolvens ATCC 35603 = DSM 2933 TaxID=398512 RepID=A0A0L6JPD8_9FIRM|nr:stalk domain-containing protein [Pseudobacteroides cellulosolvens]KNY27653.1 cellulosome anchoring protein cohesin region [Pseudobacteroides cellulosolvens ATCC 35603 = DSM 2933]